MSIHNDCCGDLLTEFTFEDLRRASPPKKKGIYVVRIKRKGRDVGEVISQVKKILEKLNWPVVGKHVLSRITRLEQLSKCQIIYIGSAGTSQSSKFTLKGRYGDFNARHTIMHPLWALLYFDWELEFGWKECEDSGIAEVDWKVRYKEKHGGKLPALVYR